MFERFMTAGSDPFELQTRGKERLLIIEYWTSFLGLEKMNIPTMDVMWLLELRWKSKVSPWSSMDASLIYAWKELELMLAQDLWRGSSMEFYEDKP